MIWLVGCRGMLGTEMADLLQTRGHAFTATDVEVDITHSEAPAAFLASRGLDRLDWIVNCAAYTAVDAAEDEPGKAFAVNETGVANLCAAARRTGAALLHVSTDYVFDGSKEGEYVEEDAPNPLGVYGLSKLRGELVVASSLARHVIVRTAWLYGRHGKNFVDTMLRLFRERDGASVVDDQRGNPTYVRDFAKAILAIVEKGCPPNGTFHFSGAGATTWYGFAQEIRAQAVARGVANPSVQVRPITTAQYPTRARRPANSTLSKEKIRGTYGIVARDWRAALAEWFDRGDDERCAG
jgi:dTDP-4-dehydrorhamnose reductase